MIANLWYVELVSNGLGIWDKEWYATRSEASARFKELQQKGYSTRTCDGGQGSLVAPRMEKIELTPEGVLQFANNFAIDTGSC